MYAYYFLASTIGKDAGLRRRYLWWGHYLTMFQMTQFATMLAQVRQTLLCTSVAKRHGNALAVPAWQGPCKCGIKVSRAPRPLRSNTFGMQALYCIVTGSYNLFLSKLLFFYMLTLLALFGNFFLSKYSKPPKPSARRKAQ